MKSRMVTLPAIWALALPLVVAGSALAAYDSGSLCADPNHPKCLGAFNPQVNTTIQLPPDGILDYTTFTVPAGINVGFAKNANNTPVIIRTSGNVDIRGALWLNGSGAACSGTDCGGYLGDDGQPGVGGPGGYDGGFGGRSSNFGGFWGESGASGKGPGGGTSSWKELSGKKDCWGTIYNVLKPSGGAFASNAAPYGFDANSGVYNTCFDGTGWGNYPVTWAKSYGTDKLVPLVGGSGGGGGYSGSNYNGSGGGGGGGAILIASSGTISVGNPDNYYSGADYINADGGCGGASGGDGRGAAGGGGSGGAIKLVADVVTGNSYPWYNNRLRARGGCVGDAHDGGLNGGGGSPGRIRIEANTMQWEAGTDPGYSFGKPGPLFVPNNPTLTITTVASQPAPANPTGSADITLPTGTTSATVTLTATNIPKGNTVDVTVTPAMAAGSSRVISSVLDGASDALTTATATIPLSPGNNVILASVTFTVTTQQLASLPTFNGEMVAKIRVESIMGGKSKMTYITASGKEYPADGANQKKIG